MKKLVFLLLIFIISFSFLGCDSTLTSSNTHDTNHQTTDDQQTTLERTIEISESELVLPLFTEYMLDYQLNFQLNDSESLTFISSNPEVVTVNQLGELETKSFGSADIIISYSADLQAQIIINVSQYYEITLPDNNTYALDEEINISTYNLSLYEEDGQLIETKSLNNEMIVDQYLNTQGLQMVEIDDNGLIYSFEIYRLSQKQNDVLFDDFIYVNEEKYVGERIDFILLKNDNDQLLSALDNVYDYQEINIVALIEKPNQDIDNVSAFWYQDFNEIISEVTINPNLRLEGTVNDTDHDYDVLVRFNSDGKPHFRLRYLPQLPGEYQLTLMVEVDGVLIQKFHKSFEVLNQRDQTYRGFVRVEVESNSHFIFDNQESYIPVGQNLAWYTSLERKHYDYKNWLSQMSDVEMNYARVWMAAWGFSPFWDDIYNFDERQTNLFSLDKTLEMAALEDIYIQLCILHHGMFSSEVNPMWSNSNDNWYTSKYGTNPYSDVIDDSGLFFTDQAMKDNFKNQLRYIVARYGYSDHIMSFELFNEVDWIETYNVADGLLWHKEMADYLKEIDSNQHLVTTSLKDRNFDSQNYKVFLLKNIDFVNVHAYGIYNHTQTLPNQQYEVQNKFNKPVMFNEIGYSGWGGQSQMEMDPNNVTLHQGLWAGAMGGGLGTGMHWWWESWTETYDVYDAYLGVGTYLKELDLTGSGQKIVYSEDNIDDGIQIDSISIGFMGYQYSDRLYLYIYDKFFNLDNQNVTSKESIVLDISGLEMNTYIFKAYDTFSGALIDSWTLEIQDQTSQIVLPNFSEDIAIIVEVIGS